MCTDVQKSGIIKYYLATIINFEKELCSYNNNFDTLFTIVYRMLLQRNVPI